MNISRSLYDMRKVSSGYNTHPLDFVIKRYIGTLVNNIQLANLFILKALRISCFFVSLDTSPKIRFDGQNGEISQLRYG